MPAPKFNPGSTASPARLRWCSQVASASALDSLNCAVSGASKGRGEGRKIKDALLAREAGEQVDDFAGWVKAKRVEFAPAPRCPLSRKVLLRNDEKKEDRYRSSGRSSDLLRWTMSVGPLRGMVLLECTQMEGPCGKACARQSDTGFPQASILQRNCNHGS
jgi:hypothetical protein